MDFSSTLDHASVSERLCDAKERESVLPSEVRAPELPRLCGRGPWIAERLHDLVGEIPLSGRKTGRILPAQSSADVVMHPRLRASDLVGAPMQLPYLLEQRLEHVVIDRQDGSTLLAAEESLDGPVVEVDTAGGRFCGRNLQRTGPPAALRTHSHIRGEHVYSRVRARKLEQCADGHVDRVPVQNVKGYHAANSKDGSQAARAPTLRGRHFGTLLHWSPFPECLRLVVRYSPLANKRFGAFQASVLRRDPGEGIASNHKGHSRPGWSMASLFPHPLARDSVGRFAFPRTPQRFALLRPGQTSRARPLSGIPLTPRFGGALE
jgi:hypothetical protein